MTIPRSSVSAICGGARRDYLDYLAICERLQLSDRMLTCARILYFERHYGAPLLGSDESLFYDLPLSLPRAGALLIFSTSHALELA